jgi:hypothetical protein
VTSMRVRNVVLLLIAQALLFSPTKAGAQASGASGMSGSYDGRYQCRDWNTLNLQVTDLGGGRIAAVFTFAVSPAMGGGQASYSMTGTYDERTGRFQLKPLQWLRRHQGYEMIGLEGTFDRASRGLRGRVDNVACQGFELVPHGTALAGMPQPPRPLPPERGKVVFNLTNYMTGPVEYWDSSMDAAPGKARESEPIDDVIDWLKSQDFWCLGTQHVSWSADGTKGIANDRNDVRERYVIECDGDCRGLGYVPTVQATMFHFAATQPVPVMEFKGIVFGGQNFQWQFTRPRTSTPPPDVYIHRWSSAKILSGQACRAPKTSR